MCPNLVTKYRVTYKDIGQCIESIKHMHIPFVIW
jgi:hypothetical protein